MIEFIIPTKTEIAEKIKYKREKLLSEKKRNIKFILFKNAIFLFPALLAVCFVLAGLFRGSCWEFVFAFVLTLIAVYIAVHIYNHPYFSTGADLLKNKYLIDIFNHVTDCTIGEIYSETFSCNSQLYYYIYERTDEILSCNLRIKDMGTKQKGKLVLKYVDSVGMVQHRVFKVKIKGIAYECTVPTLEIDLIRNEIYFTIPYKGDFSLVREQEVKFDLMPFIKEQKEEFEKCDLTIQAAKGLYISSGTEIRSSFSEYGKNR